MIGERGRREKGNGERGNREKGEKGNSKPLSIFHWEKTRQTGKSQRRRVAKNETNFEIRAFKRCSLMKVEGKMFAAAVDAVEQSTKYKVPSSIYSLCDSASWRLRVFAVISVVVSFPK